MRRSVLAVIGWFALVAVVSPAYAAAEPPEPDREVRRAWGKKHRERGPERFIEQHAEELGLDDKTREAIQELVDDSHERAEKLKKGAEKDRETLRELLAEPSPDRDEVMSVTEAMGARNLEERKNRMQAILDIRELLTEEQRRKLLGIRDDRKSRRHDRRGMRGSCRDDFQKVCTDAAPGKATLQCLSEQWDELSDDCQQSLEGGVTRGLRRGRMGRDAPE